MTEGRYYLLQLVAHCGGSGSPSYTDNVFYCKENDRNCRKVWQLTGEKYGSSQGKSMAAHRGKVWQLTGGKYSNSQGESMAAHRGKVWQLTGIFVLLYKNYKTIKIKSSQLTNDVTYT